MVFNPKWNERIEGALAENLFKLSSFLVAVKSTTESLHFEPNKKRVWRTLELVKFLFCWRGTKFVIRTSYYEDSDHQTFNLKLSRRKFHLQTIWSQDSNYESKFLIATTSKQFENRKVQLEIPRTIQLFTKRASPCVAPTRSESPGTGGSKSNLVSSRLQAII